MKKTVAATFLFCILFSACSPRHKYEVITGFAQGGVYSVKLDLATRDGKILRAADVREGIDSVLEKIDNSVSGYNRGSILSRFNAGEKVVPDEVFTQLYRLSRKYYDMTGGSFDVSCAPLFDLWGFGFTSDSLPSAQKVRETLAGTGMDRLTDTLVTDADGFASSRMILLKDTGSLPELNFNAIAQGYSADLVASYLHSLGVDAMLVDVGGEIYCEGLNQSGEPWSIGIDRPVDGNYSPGEDMQGIFRTGPEPRGVVTSGNYRKFYVRDGKKYAHTIDPRTGYPVEHSLLSATVIAGTATEADALATYCMVAGFAKARDFIESRDDLEACLIYEEAGQMKTWTSSGLSLELL